MEKVHFFTLRFRGFMVGNSRDSGYLRITTCDRSFLYQYGLVQGARVFRPALPPATLSISAPIKLADGQLLDTLVNRWQPRS